MIGSSGGNTTFFSGMDILDQALGSGPYAAMMAATVEWLVLGVLVAGGDADCDEVGAAVAVANTVFPWPTSDAAACIVGVGLITGASIADELLVGEAVRSALGGGVGRSVSTVLRAIAPSLNSLDGDERLVVFRSCSILAKLFSLFFLAVSMIISIFRRGEVAWIGRDASVRALEIGSWVGLMVSVPKSFLFVWSLGGTVWCLVLNTDGDGGVIDKLWFRPASEEGVVASRSMTSIVSSSFGCMSGLAGDVGEVLLDETECFGLATSIVFSEGASKGLTGALPILGHLLLLGLRNLGRGGGGIDGPASAHPP